MTQKTNRFILRERTNDVHATLESAVGQFSDAETYIRYLRGMMTFRETIERQLVSAAASVVIHGWLPGEIAPLLRKDLEDLGQIKPKAASSFDLPNDRQGLLGVLYVLEGSGLGARVLTRRAEKLGYSPSFGARHLASQISRADSWNSLLGLLDEIATSDIDRTVQAARMTFKVAIDVFER
ncbi:biliverdin-producing heme oxygenase [Rhizobium mesosinicum]|uniref:Biliverdin-producing heme oxygenase n=1 Tax=Rhizobium mesosinicum TaxID=335017 RepID=A0ABS7GWT7_9HYPH|nr:biliverdin-producing heme oxygenase [Rhizobium mesosinicum]MBW9054424.1 biliverdin-producing heme oxygenase [Rhizobium mesosinicum]